MLGSANFDYPMDIWRRLLGPFYVTGVFWYRLHRWGVALLPDRAVGVIILVFTSFFFVFLVRIRTAIAANLGVVDRIINEPIGGAHRDHKAMSLEIKGVIQDTLAELERLLEPDLGSPGSRDGIAGREVDGGGERVDVGQRAPRSPRQEAAENAVLNGLASRFTIMDQPLSQLPHGEKYTIITANLRYPTLVRLCGTVDSYLATAGSLVLSGIKSDEMAVILAVYGEKGLACRWQATEKGWVGLVLQQRPS